MLKKNDTSLKSESSVETDPLWYKDAIIYQLHVKSFFDANNDGIGDFAGLLAKLDYIASLGVNTIWLLPFYPSPRLDDGYDIAEYREDRKSTRLNSSHANISYAVFCLKKKTNITYADSFLK